MTENGKELAHDTDKPTFIAVILFAIMLCLVVGADVYRWAHGQWLAPPRSPSNLLQWFSFTMLVLTMAWCAVTFLRSERVVGIAFALLFINCVIEAVLFIISASTVTIVLMYIRPAFNLAALICLIVWVVLWFKSVVVHV